ncbi:MULTISPECIES: phage baseplate protein [unclassified Acinetobacter]|uniref:phage baseplate protein n=1 Tax=unclassified Acinetobacter TaxID=196816 RepID=UPI002934E9DE|nr:MULTISPECIES: hypothetical protein [unclassified Acinetobacter]WOE32185.1 hypothetical protein QSG84_02930 [Acinetobacter sp. SAAs470]WOE37655.1 hypothetical protein QSG86_11975 [Acinetobacter sp. SAAs474]
MAISDVIGSTMASPITDTVGSLLVGGNRSVMGMFADVVVKETHKDEWIITEHPVEYGSPISDHVYKVPEEVTMEMGWSESAGKLNSLLGGSFIGLSMSLRGIYQGFLALGGQKLMISTGKRLYTNMVIKNIHCETDMTTENALILKITFKKVIIATTKETEVLIEDQKNPEVTSGVQNEGTKQAQPVNQSLVTQISGFGQTGGAYTLGWPLW